MTAETDRRNVAVAGRRLSYLVAGPEDAPPVVLLHGGGVDAAAFSWTHVLEGLSDRFRVYAPDLPGYGASEANESVRGTVDYVDVVAEFLDAVGVTSAAVAGISLGGGVALGLALDHPDRVTRLVLVDSYGLGSSVPGGRMGYWFTRTPSLVDLTWRLFARSKRLTALAVRGIVHPSSVSDELVDDVFDLIRRPGAGRTFYRFQRHEVGPHGLRTNYLDRLPSLATPTLLLHGEDDPLVPVAWAVRAATMLPDATLRVLPNCGHIPPRERPDAVVDALESFLAEA